MSTFIPINIELKNEVDIPTKTYAVDFDKGRIIGKVEGINAVNQFIKKTLMTPRFKCLIYDNQYGSEIKQCAIKGGATPEYIETEIPRLVQDALLCDERILKIYDFSFSFDKNGAYIFFRADTIFGEISFEEVI